MTLTFKILDADGGKADILESARDTASSSGMSTDGDIEESDDDIDMELSAPSESDSMDDEEY